MSSLPRRDRFLGSVGRIDPNHCTLAAQSRLVRNEDVARCTRGPMRIRKRRADSDKDDRQDSSCAGYDSGDGPDDYYGSLLQPWRNSCRVPATFGYWRQRSLTRDVGFVVKSMVVPTELRQRMTNALFFSFWLG
jgi:hypothetical protein